MKPRQWGKGQLSPPAHEPPTKPHLLYVEDNAINAHIACVQLGRRYQMALARSDEEACRYLRTAKERVHGILMDIELMGSQLDGVELARLLRGQLADREVPEALKGVPLVSAPIIFVTGMPERYGQAMMNTVGNGWVAKPVDFSQLGALLDQVLAEKAAAP